MLDLDSRLKSSGRALESAREVWTQAKLVEGRNRSLLLTKSTEEQEDEQEEGATNDTRLAPLMRQDRLLQWLRWRKLLAHLAQAAQVALDKDESAEVQVTLDGLKRCAKVLEGSNCANLRRLTEETLGSTAAVVAIVTKDRLQQDLEKLNYPQCVLESSSVGKLVDSERSAEVIEVFRAHFELLTFLSSVVDSERPSTVMLEPLRKRFKYHFFGRRKTNNIVRPEWFLQQIKLWLKGGARFFDFCMGVSIRSILGIPRGSIIAERSNFDRGLLLLASEKLRIDLKELELDDILLSHAIDEVLIFTKDVAPFAQAVDPDLWPVSVLAEKKVYQRWLSLERKYAFEKIDAILLENEGLQACPLNPDILRCVDEFIGLLQILVARFKPLAQENLQLHFLALLLELLEDFRMRLVKLLHSEKRMLLSSSEVFPLALNSAAHLADTLESWQETPLFLRLALAHQEENPAVFATIAEGFRFIVQDSAIEAAELVSYEVRAQSLDYCRLDWTSDHKQDPTDQTSPSPESLGMFQTLSVNLMSVCQHLRPEVSARVINHLTELLTDFFLFDMILQNEFSWSGATCLKTDINMGLLPILRQFSPDLSQARKINDALFLLADLPAPTALLLKDSLLEYHDIKEAKELLQEHEVEMLSASMAAKVLDKRIDLRQMLI